MTIDPTHLVPALALTAFFSLILTGLSVAVSLGRTKAGEDIGPAQNPDLLRRVRAHGNFSEYAPTAVLLVAALGAVGAGMGLVWGAAILFALSRALHAAGMLAGQGPMFRAAAMLIQHLTFVAGAAVVIVRLVYPG